MTLIIYGSLYISGFQKPAGRHCMHNVKVIYGKQKRRCYVTLREINQIYILLTSYLKYGRGCVPWLASKMFTFLVNLELWCPPPCLSPPSRHSLPMGSHMTPAYERLQGSMGSVVQVRVSVSYTSKFFTGRLH